MFQSVVSVSHVVAVVLVVDVASVPSLHTGLYFRSDIP